MQEESNTADKMVVQDKRSIYYVRYPNLAIYYCLTMASGHYLPILYHNEGDKEEDLLSGLTKPWRGEFLCFLNAKDVILENVGLVEWWGVSVFSPLLTFIHEKKRNTQGWMDKHGPQ